MKKRKLSKFFIKNNLILGIIGFWMSSSYAICGIDQTCPGNDTNNPSDSNNPLRPRCEPMMCFQTKAAQKEYEFKKDCVFKNKCDFAVEGVEHELNKIPKNDPTWGFYRNQDCIAGQSCSHKGQLDDSKWIDNVVYDFITPLVEEQGEWKDIKIRCQFFPIPRNLRCQQFMAQYHIKEDLQNSLNKNGCGTQKDWDQIGIWLEDCIKTGIQQDIPSGLQTISAAYAASEVKTERDKVRATCIQYRQQNNLSIENN
jgi:hypothetical protein